MPIETHGEVLVDLGTVSISPGAANLVRERRMSMDDLLWDHRNGRWGNIGETDSRENLMATLRGYGSVISRIETPKARCRVSPENWIFVVTDVGLPATRVRLASEQ